MRHVVVDTNCLLRMIPVRSKFRPSWEAFLDEKFIMCNSNLVTADPDDNKFVDCAVAANARFIVTGDHHFNVLRHIAFPVVDVISIDDFLKEVQSAYS